jgi:hypothetical protein
MSIGATCAVPLRMTPGDVRVVKRKANSVQEKEDLAEV